MTKQFSLKMSMKDVLAWCGEENCGINDLVFERRENGGEKRGKRDKNVLEVETQMLQCNQSKHRVCEGKKGERGRKSGEE